MFAEIGDCTLQGIDKCHKESSCHEVGNSYTCVCNAGLTGSGRYCSGEHLQTYSDERSSVPIFFIIFCYNMGKRKSVCCNKNVQRIKASTSQIAKRLEWRLSLRLPCKHGTHCIPWAQRRSARPVVGSHPEPAQPSNRYLLYNLTPVHIKDLSPLLLLA